MASKQIKKGSKFFMIGDSIKVCKLLKFTLDSTNIQWFVSYKVLNCNDSTVYTLARSEFDKLQSKGVIVKAQTLKALLHKAKMIILFNTMDIKRLDAISDAREIERIKEASSIAQNDIDNAILTNDIIHVVKYHNA